MWRGLNHVMWCICAVKTLCDWTCSGATASNRLGFFLASLVQEENRLSAFFCVGLSVCLCVCCGLTLITTNTHAIVKEKVLVGELAHHAGCFKERLWGRKTREESLLICVLSTQNMKQKMFIFKSHPFTHSVTYSIIKPTSEKLRWALSRTLMTTSIWWISP